jgi:hypothetical protein
MMKVRKPRLFFQPAQQNTIASTEPGHHGLELRRKARLGVEVLTVSAVEVAVPEGVTVAGEKLHDAPVGNPVQLNETGEANELRGVTVTVEVPLCPAVTLSVCGEIAIVKLGVDVAGGRLMV